ncbi:hypothetical protein [Streptomyces orinoci]|uniref:Uncharacterized protein n=1 Tax=Streptomyces orinoci TaxID=67339 RepID=A0ABV3JY95_STRON|nr:hypothetical protein [Streptomyces orinoci]
MESDKEAPPRIQSGFIGPRLIFPAGETPYLPCPYLMGLTGRRPGHEPDDDELPDLPNFMK